MTSENLNDGYLVIAWVLPYTPTTYIGDIEVHVGHDRRSVIELAKFGLEQWTTPPKPISGRAVG